MADEVAGKHQRRSEAPRRRIRSNGLTEYDGDGPLMVTPQKSEKPEMLQRTLKIMARVVLKLQTGAFINHMWGEAGTTLGNVQMFFVRLLMIWPLKVIAPTAYAYWFWQFSLRLRGKTVPPAIRARGVLGLAKNTFFWMGREFLRFWAGVECVFYLYYHYKLWELDRRNAITSVLPRGESIKALRRALGTVEIVHQGGKIVDPQLALSQNLDSLGADGMRSPDLTPASSAQDLQAFLKPKQVESVENLLRDWQSARESATKKRSLDARIVPTAIMVSDRMAFEQLLDDAEILALKQAEACGWFLRRRRGKFERWPLSRVHELRQGNIREWVAWAFINCHAEDVPPDREDEVLELIQEIVAWVGVPCQPGFNKEVSAMRLTLDPVPAAPRPLLYYVFTQTLFSQIITIQLRALGFRQYLSGTLAYWHRPATAAGAAADQETPPIVFCHGIGVNVLPYRPLLNAMLETFPDRSFFLPSLPHISMRMKEEVPSSTEMVACLSDMLGSWGHPSAHFVGHSFGSLPLAWMAKKAPERVSAMTFIDPVCFLLIKPDVCYNFMYREPQDPTQLLIHFFLAQELYIAHSLSRNFFWHQNLLWPEELPGPTLVVLGGRDSIVPAHSIRRYLAAWKQRNKVTSLKLLWFPELGHGEINFGPVGEAACDRIVSDMHLMETECLRGGKSRSPQIEAAAHSPAAP